MYDLELTEGSSPDESGSIGDASLDEIILAYLASGDRGLPRRQAWLDRHPEHAAELADFFAGEGLLPLLDAPDESGDTLSFLTPVVPIRTGTKFGNYSIIDVLGRGGMGVVYRAWQNSPRRFVALKMIAGGSRHSASEARRFRAEADAIAKLADPGIVKIHEVGEENGRAYFTMELVAGRSLDHHLKRFKGNCRAAADLVVLAARAVHHAHVRGILHRDLKPSNLLLGTGDRPIVSDFGLARRIEMESDLTEVGTILGSPRYMAPESIEARPGEITTAVDVYGLGAVLYALLTGVPPFDGKTQAEVLDQVRHKEPAAPRSIDRAIPQDLETICLKCLAKSPGSRYKSAEAVAEDLNRWIEGRPILGRRVGVVGKIRSWARRKPSQAALTLALVFAVFAGLGGILWHWQQAVAAREKAVVALKRADVALKQADAHREMAESQLYASRIAEADRELIAGEIGLAMKLLESCPPSQRDWEWAHLRSGGRTITVEPTVPGAKFIDLAYGPGGRSIALLEAVGEAAFVRVIDRQTGRQNWMSPAGKATFNRIAFDPKGARVVASNGRGQLIALDALTGEPVWSYPERPNGGFWSLAYSPDGRFLAAGQEGIYLIDARDGKELYRFTGHRGKVVSLSFDRDGNRLASAGFDGTVNLWDIPRRHLIRKIPEEESQPIHAVSFSPDGKKLVGGTRFGTVELWDADSGKTLARVPGHGDAITRVTFTAEGCRFATGGPGESIRIWACEPGRDLVEILKMARVDSGLVFSPDGSELASVGKSLIIRLAPPPGLPLGSRLAFLKGHAGTTTDLIFSPDGLRLATSARDRTILIRDAAKGTEILRLPNQGAIPNRLAFRPDGLELISGDMDGTVRVWDIEKRKSRLTLDELKSPITAVAYNRKRPIFATGDADGQVMLREASTGRVVGHFPFKGVIQGLEFCPDGSRLAVTPADASLRIIKLDEVGPACEFRPTGAIVAATGCSFSPDGQSVAVVTDGAVMVVELRTGQPIVLVDDLRSPVRSMAYSHDGHLLAIATENRTLTIWDALTGVKLAASPVPVARISRLRFTPNARQLAAIAGDSIILVWDVDEALATHRLEP